ncbi:MAG: PDZ domain-containing protein [Nitrospira sp.]|nr:PDZ domain-containing protein [Nitrospira sp.]
MEAPSSLSKRVGLFAFLVGGGVLLAHSINAFVADALRATPLPSATPTQSESPAMVTTVSYAPHRFVEDVRSSGLFALPPQREPVNPEGSGTPIRTSIGAATKISLIGVVMGERTGVFAIIEEQATKKQTLYRLHDEIPDVGEVVDIRRNGIVVRQGNLEELVELAIPEQPRGADLEAAGSSFAATSSSSIRKVVDRREVDQALNDLPRLLTQARAVPYMLNGAINGFRIDYMAPASFYEKIGIRTGDILQRVNGVEIRDPATVLNLLQQLKHEQVVKLDLVRNNRRTTVTYELR